MMEVVVKEEVTDPSLRPLNCEDKEANTDVVGVVPKEENADVTLPGYGGTTVAMVKTAGVDQVLQENGCSQRDANVDWSPSHHSMCGELRPDHRASKRPLPVSWDPRDASSYSDVQPRNPDLMDKLREREQSRQRRHPKEHLSSTAVVDKEEHQHQQQRRLSTLLGNKNAAKSSRLIEFGWKHNGHQVRSRGGGGTRRLAVPKNAAYSDLLRLGKELFFPEGFSKKGPVGNFLLDIRDFSGTEIPRDATVGSLYEPLKRMVRLYLCSLDRTDIESVSEPEVRLDSGSESCGSENIASPTRLPQPGQPQLASASTSTSSLSDVNGSNGLNDFAREVHGDLDESYHFAVEVPLSPSLSPALRTGHNNNHHHAPLESNGDCNDDSVTSNSQASLHHRLPPQSNFNGDSSLDLLGDPPREALHLHVVEAPPRPKKARAEPCSRTLRLRRVNIVCDMVKHFKHPGAVDTALSVTFSGESGIDMSGLTTKPQSYLDKSAIDMSGLTTTSQSYMDKSGIDTSCLASTSFRDKSSINASRLPTTPKTLINIPNDLTSAREAYSSFWTTLLQTNTGAAVEAGGEWGRVLSLRPDRGKAEWEAVGRILLKGYQDLRFFPTSLALPFTVCLVHGEEALTPDMLIRPFLRLIPSRDRDVLCAALEGGTYEVDGLLDVLLKMRVGTLPDGGSVEDVVARLGHARFIQEPMYALVHMTSTAQMGLKRLLPTVAAVVALYHT